MKIFNLNNLIRLTMINFLILLTLFLYFGNRPKAPVNKANTSIPETLQRVPTVIVADSSLQETVATPSASPTTSKAKPTPKKPTLAELVSPHNSKTDCWIIYSGKSYDITSYFGSHPGGDGTMVKYCGKDATAAFDSKDKSNPSPHSAVAEQLLSQYEVN